MSGGVKTWHIGNAGETAALCGGPAHDLMAAEPVTIAHAKAQDILCAPCLRVWEARAWKGKRRPRSNDRVLRQCRTCECVTEHAYAEVDARRGNWLCIVHLATHLTPRLEVRA